VLVPELPVVVLVSVVALVSVPELSSRKCKVACYKCTAEADIGTHHCKHNET